MSVTVKQIISNPIDDMRLGPRLHFEILCRFSPEMIQDMNHARGHNIDLITNDITDEINRILKIEASPKAIDNKLIKIQGL